MLLEFSYIALTVVIVAILFFFGSYAINHSIEGPEKFRKKMILLLGLLLWQVLIFCVAISGFLSDFSFPPRIGTVFIGPSFLFTAVFLLRNRKKQWIHSIPQLWLTIFQSFRILVETLFVFTVSVGFLPKSLSIEGYNYDMVFGFTAIVMAAIVYFSKSLPKKLLIVWNFMGIAVLLSVIFVFMTTIFYPEMYPEQVGEFPKEAGMYPYVIVAVFLMPAAIFVHVLALVQLFHTKNR